MIRNDVRRGFALVLVFAGTLLPVAGQTREIPGNALYDHLDTLRVAGDLERSSLHFHSYSDSLWLAEGEHEEDDLGLHVYDPRNHLTYNHYSPYGGNDTGLWQGRGINNALTGGVAYRSKHFSVTIAPEVCFSQNLPYELVEPSGYSGSEYGHWLPAIDYPQRFGDSAIVDWSPGQSEVRGNWRRLTAGFGTQSVWLGSAKRNSLLYSSNAAGFPPFRRGTASHGDKSRNVRVPYSVGVVENLRLLRSPRIVSVRVVYQQRAFRMEAAVYRRVVARNTPNRPSTS